MTSPRIVVRHSPIHGRGVFAQRELPAGERVIEYRGLRVARADAEQLPTPGHTFLFALNGQWSIDGSRNGNSARFINHGCAPNCEAVVYVDRHGDEARDRVFIETLRPVRAGAELLFDYGIVLPVRHTAALARAWACRCGAAQCRGTMLASQRRTT